MRRQAGGADFVIAKLAPLGISVFAKGNTPDGGAAKRAAARLEVGIEQANGAEALLLRVRHHVGAEQQQRLG